MAVGLVVEVVYLLAHLFAGFAREQFVALHHAGIVRRETGGFAGGAERIEHPVAPGHVGRIEISHAARRLETYFAHLKLLQNNLRRLYHLFPSACKFFALTAGAWIWFNMGHLRKWII
jgi:hypothetical protein